ncbi:Glutamine synthetase [Fusobacterium sp. DD29]|uniref:glutamine synthetase III family protein n=1 Tax=unclassified Fusobacterium TaxID=2648384 RepID=UPI001B8BA69E|nr:MULTISPECIES: glutamine synthetase III [unclassified Fusobacterium]MBR8702171.1 Glutamine synthetase [Fusobacterium sp. DD45]MBR8711994.1 Glutamine synthetase [Fusobacterium sp. DD28]MBR8750041.1 Glutamine synthetase [Fusobacterium sp. DD29]MBR8752567.1 Glutamine synthetase [Fusobacterium sp. DD26]MBR8762279.1 Glutamine synthetase [Fusobacterium sp. DD25]
MNTMLEVFGINYFSELELKSRVPSSFFKKFKAVQLGEAQMSLELADVIANAVKTWATEKGATHFTHWFQPLTELTAEKHESFISVTAEGTIMSQFSGKDLIKGEADTSSFPNGGLRSTFEARGYTAWDTNSPMFIKGEGATKSLYIPTAFVGYNGEALDKKVPLLRSIKTLETEAIRIQRLLGDEKTKHINVTLGVEQEYFLVEKEFYDKRQDLVLAGRTLFGNLPPKGQELNDHYYGTIKERIEVFMSELDSELWKLGVMAKTKHNEVAPSQFEIALMFTSANVSVDQNHLAMDTIKKVAIRHGLAALLHEKPFQGVNGSGKHCNWSMCTDTGINLFDPDNLSNDNFQFLLYTMAVVEGIDRYADVLRACTATPGNDHRLGGNEAPPAIISIFLGEQLQEFLENIGKMDFTNSTGSNETIDIDITMPKIPKDISDRNRTSPFAFTGNKFEFRMPGSSASASTPVFMINTIVADILREYADYLEKVDPNENINKAVIKLIKNRYNKHKRIIFNGNGYDSAWIENAKRLGLSNLKNTIEGIPVYIREETIALFERNRVLSRNELYSRFKVYSDRFNKQTNIEISTAVKMARNEIYPCIIKYITNIAQMINSVREALKEEEYIQFDKEHLIKVIGYKNRLKNTITSLNEGLKKAVAIPDEYERACFYNKELIPILNEMRVIVDALEILIDKTVWPIPTYYDLLFRL